MSDDVNADDQTEGLLTTAQVAEWWDQTPATVRQQARQGSLPSRLIRGKRCYAKADVEEHAPHVCLRPSGERANPVRRIPDDFWPEKVTP